MARAGRIFERVKVTDNEYEYRPVTFYVEKADYVSGGITLNFPAGTFVAAPFVDVTCVLKNAPYSAIAHMTACVTALTKDLVTIRANKGGAAVVECATDDIAVHVKAWGKPG